MTTTNPVITNPPPSTSSDVSFDQIVKGNISIKKSCKSKDRYIITFSKIGKFLMYQVWNKDNVNNINNKRKVYYVPPKEWINQFNERNEGLKKNGNPFRPTTIMETEDDGNYAFVIHKAYINSSGHVVFIVSTKEISLQNNTSKKLTQIPCGKFNNVRFDIDEDERRWISGRPAVCCIDNQRCFGDVQQGWYQKKDAFIDWYYYSANYLSNEDRLNDDYMQNGDGTPWAYAC